MLGTSSGRLRTRYIYKLRERSDRARQQHRSRRDHDVNKYREQRHEQSGEEGARCHYTMGHTGV